MIDIILYEDVHSYYVEVIGHSGSRGNSIVCSSVSILLETWRLSELALEDVSVPYENGVIKGCVPKTTISQILFTQLCIGLRSIHGNFSSEISLIIGG